MRQAWMLALALRRTLLWLALGLLFAGPAMAAEPSDVETSLSVTMPGGEARQAALAEVMALLNIPSVSVALIDQDRIAWAKAYGQDATPDTLFQAASLSKFVAAVGAMRLVDQKRLTLDQDVNAQLTSWKVPSTISTRSIRLSCGAFSA